MKFFKALGDFHLFSRNLKEFLTKEFPEKKPQPSLNQTYSARDRIRFQK